MGDDLLKAEHALAAGNLAEARVFAWNALATAEEMELPRLRAVAMGLDDRVLIRELDRRAVPLDDPQAKEPSEFKWRSLIFPAAIVALILVLSANTFSTEPGPPKPGGSDVVLAPPEGLPVLSESSGAWIVRIGRSERVPLQELADDISLRYRIPVGVLPEIALLPSSVVHGDELDGDALLGMLRQWYVAGDGAAIIGVTDFPMFSEALDPRRPFMLRNSRYGVVSTADLGASLWSRIQGHTRGERTRKLVARGIGFLYLNRPVSSDTHSLLRSEMSGTGDIDALDERL